MLFIELKVSFQNILEMIFFWFCVDYYDDNCVHRFSQKADCLPTLNVKLGKMQLMLHIPPKQEQMHQLDKERTMQGMRNVLQENMGPDWNHPFRGPKAFFDKFVRLQFQIEYSIAIYFVKYPIRINY